METMTEAQAAELLRDHERKELLRFVTVGSVDDGKSTLIGRLLHDTDGVYEDQLAAVRKASRMEGSEIDFSLITDGLKAEREQGITIDVAYRYFTTARRKFIIADTPGHVQYTRNMATGASTADVAIILLDARLGVLPQSRRHAWITSMLGIRHLAVAVNKMDLVDYEQATYARHEAEFRAFADDLDFEAVTFFPISAVKGDNVVEPGGRTPWYEGPSILEFLETVPIPRREEGSFRFPVQTVLRPNLNYRGFAGQVASGVVREGAKVVALPQRTEAVVAGIDLYGETIAEARAPLSVTLRLDREVDVSRGDMIVPADDVPEVRRQFDAMVVWLSEKAHDPNKTYLLKHTSRFVRARIPKVSWSLDMNTLAQAEVEHLSLNDIGRVRVESHQPLYTDPYRVNRRTGAFIVIDSMTNNTVGAGMILERGAERSLEDDAAATGARREVSPAERRELLGHGGAVVWLTGLPASGKSTIAFALERGLFDRGTLAHVLDPDDFAAPDGSATPTSPSPEAVAQMARAVADAGGIAIVSFVSPDADERDAARAIVGAKRFVEVHVATAEKVCRTRDARGLWDGVAAGTLAGVPGVDAPYVDPPSPALTVDTAGQRRDEIVRALCDLLAQRGVLAQG
ncbi:MAG: sulfate adenylyltransferase subunit CysN [Deltaproteobacteria bacterium]|nr:MAG: sulfate adenylyltransferase subunit CysN [Deltaproteobacteria bacterium]